MQPADQTPLNVLIFCGTARDGNNTQHIAQFIHELADARDDMDVTIVTPRDYDLELDDEAGADVPDLTEKVIAADAYLIVSPEYNHGYPGSLKFLLDLHLKEYIHKPVALTGVSAGPFGGTRVIEQLTGVVRELGMQVTFTDLNISAVHEELDDDGSLKDREKWEGRAEKMLDELAWMGHVLRWGRENVDSQYHE
jgi:NAD(P)H-dependent FMN reductase